MAGEPTSVDWSGTSLIMPDCAADGDVVADLQVARDADLPGQRHVVPDRHAAGDADLRDEQPVRADLRAVADRRRGR